MVDGDPDGSAFSEESPTESLLSCLHTGLYLTKTPLSETTATVDDGRLSWTLDDNGSLVYSVPLRHPVIYKYLTSRILCRTFHRVDRTPPVLGLCGIFTFCHSLSTRHKA